jgi:hypothetical protein
MASWAPNARAVVGFGPVTIVDHKGLLFELDEVVTRDGAMRVEKLVGDIGEDGDAAGRDAALVADGKGFERIT